MRFYAAAYACADSHTRSTQYADRIYILAIENLENAQILYALLHEFCRSAHLEQVEFPLGRTCLCVNLLNIINIYKLCVYFYNTNRIYIRICSRIPHMCYARPLRTHIQIRIL
jgi:hypothetical protein